MTYSYNGGVNYIGHSQIIVTQLKVCFRFRGKLFGGTDPPNNTLFVGTVPPITHNLVEQFRQIAYSLEEHLIHVWGLKIRIFIIIIFMRTKWLNCVNGWLNCVNSLYSGSLSVKTAWFWNIFFCFVIDVWGGV